MRNALPDAAVIGWIHGESVYGWQSEDEEAVVRDYANIYKFPQSIEDGATAAPLCYENLIPELQLAIENFNDHLVNQLSPESLTEFDAPQTQSIPCNEFASSWSFLEMQQ